MNSSWKFFLGLTATCLFIQAVYAMLEMACVSFNKVRLQYYVSKNNRRAIWLSYLLNHPGQLFGTTLIATNVALQFGSECSRRFYETLGLSPDLAPLTQVIIVLIFAEISPMLAARRHAEHVAMLGIPLLYLASIILRPIIWVLDLLCRSISHLIGKPFIPGTYLSREELQKILEQREEPLFLKSDPGDFNTIVSNIFSLKNKTAKELMEPLKNIQMLPAGCTVSQMRMLLKEGYTPFVPLYHQIPENIVAIAYSRDLLRLQENRRVREKARSAWFITEKNSILQILKQFRRNNQSIAVVLNEAGLASGILTLDEIVNEVFGRSDKLTALGEASSESQQIIVDRTFPSDTKIVDFNEKFHVHLDTSGVETLGELFEKTLGHLPIKGESVRIEQFELTVEEASILGIKAISIRTLF